MKVKLINFTPDALELLLFTKNTRLSVDSPLTLEGIKKWPWEKKREHLKYMRNTIQSSWEFVDYVFQITEVTRAFTHQLVRTRTASYAQQTQRAVDVRDSTWETPDGLNKDETILFNDTVAMCLNHYAVLADWGASIQNARGVLPTNIHTSIIAKMNLRTLSNIAEHRLCTRTQGEYQDVVRAMIGLVYKTHPWVEEFGFLEVYCVKHGICAFPRYDGCPFQKLTLHGEALAATKEAIKKAFYSERHEAIPVVAKEATTK